MEGDISQYRHKIIFIFINIYILFIYLLIHDIYIYKICILIINIINHKIIILFAQLIISTTCRPAAVILLV